jgi:formate dehydrogenase assembly factor FdhD
MLRPRPRPGNDPLQPMIRLTKTLNAWGTSGFEDVLKAEVGQIPADQLPLQQALSTSSHVTDSQRTVLMLSVADDEELIHVTAGILYSGIIAGCSCADDPTPVDEQNEYCEVQIEINKKTAEATVALRVN